VHEGVEAADAGEGCVECGLVPGEERFGGVAGTGFEVCAEGGESAASSTLRFEFDNREGKGGVAGQAAAVRVGDDVGGKVVLMEPARERQKTALCPAELLDLCDDDWAGIVVWAGLDHLRLGIISA
jgi:hypothetical protein